MDLHPLLRELVVARREAIRTAGIGAALELNARASVVSEGAQQVAGLAARAIDDAVASASPGERLVIRTSSPDELTSLHLFIGCGETAFESTFATARKGDPGAGAPASEPVVAGARTVLLVDDDADTVELFSRALRRRGYDVIGASGVDEAVRIGAARRFDVLISDLNLADGTAVELIARLGQPSRTIAVTGASGDVDVKRVLGAGYRKLLIKPVTLPMIEAAISELLSDG